MSLYEDESKCMELLIHHEEAMGSLYEQFAGFSERYRSFWLEMVGEEAKHQVWLRTLWQWVKEKKGQILSDRFPAAAIQNSLDFIQQQIRYIQIEPVSGKRALAMALDIENALIEKRFLDIFHTDSTEFQDVVQKLIEETQIHREKLHRLIREAV